ncbi:sugar ABC transporter substrate-binding protein [Bacillus badius]|uniref:Sugar ABC transporter n=1 Tax=Bacillus badius TaxID=1455 RepID=A0ABR5ARJ2_BACBA|nr:sugar ABC transporter substrate-binding protein [Bacillus badius]KIL72463.1 putative sugar ABC transporter [Bacillus badius]KIL77357.1 putative sugar ABC transporter [Bacillus badius]KZO01018.1 sugar ABC transporter substrate-binding protein [Bacillus badius]KZR58018.1 sugar ABC transporter substrate-binding protein [Bacillus badius]MED4718578.1 sugar ABC transporter substrate-binding protein [Bacillus badius]
MRKLFKKLAVSGLTFTLLLTGCSAGEEGASSSSGKTPGKIENVPERFANGEEVKVKVIRKIGGDDHTAQFLAGAKKEGEELGFKVDIFTANGDTAKFHDAIAQAANQDYDGVVISHGDDAATADAVKKLTEKGKSVVAFDSIEKLKEVEGVTLTSQDDKALAALSLDQLVKDFNGKANIAYLWVDGFPPMVRRNAVYEETLKKNPGIKEVERFGVAAADTSVQTQNAVQAMLKKYPKGKLDAIYATWDAFAIGAARAIKEAGREEVKIYGIDVSNADLQLIQEKGSSWKYTAAVDPALIGKIDMRILAKKLAGEETPQEYALDASLISQKELASSKEPVNMESLKSVIPNWGKSDAFEEEWMKTLKEHY